MNTANRTGALALVMIGVLGGLPDTARSQPEYVEDFSTDTNMNPSGTELDWNTEAGEIRLWPFEAAIIEIYDTPGNTARSIEVNGDYVFVGAGGTVQVVDISNPENPVAAGSFSLPAGAARNIKVAGNYAYVTTGDAGLLILDISDPENPVEVTYYASPGFLRDLAVDGNYIYLSTRNIGMEVLDISNPAEPALVGVLSGTGEMRGIHIEGDRAFLANEANGLLLIDISDPANPILDQTVDTAGHAYDVVVRGERALVADFGDGLNSIRISRRLTLENLGLITGAGTFGDPVISGDYMYLPDLNDGLRIYDIATPVNPVQVGVFAAEERINGLAISGDLAVAGQSTGFVQILDLSDPVFPVVLGQVSTSGHPGNVVINGDYAYVAAGIFLEVVDFSDPSAPALVASVPTLGTYGIVMDGNRILVFSNNGIGSDLQIFDALNPALPVELGVYSSAGPITDLIVRNDLVYVSGRDPQLQIVDISNPAAPFLTGSSGDAQNNSYTGGLAIHGANLYQMNSAGIGRHVLYGSDQVIFSGTNYFEDLGERLVFHGEMLYCVGIGNGGITVIQESQHLADTLNNRAESKLVTLSEDLFYKFRFNTIGGSSANWSFSSPDNNEYYVDENVWTKLHVLSNSLYWVARLKFFFETLSPVSELKIEWLYEHALITAITDVPNDQGRQVRLKWARSGHDFVGDETQIVEYAIYRQIDEENFDKSSITPDLSGASASLLDNISLNSAAGWDFLRTVPVLAEDNYATVVPTLVDSTAVDGPYQTTFKIVALTATPGVFFTSRPDSGSSVDNLAPGVPMGIMADYNSNSVNLSWEEAEDDDFRYFRIYRGNDPAFIPHSGNLVQEVATAAWQDNSDTPWQFHYKITAVDFSGNESPAGEILIATDTPEAGHRFALLGAVPNPFNPSTLIEYSLASGGKVQLKIYDVAGRLIRTLVDDVMPSGKHSIRWNGRNQAGEAVASGAYYSLLRSGDQVQKKSMLLVK